MIGDGLFKFSCNFESSLIDQFQYILVHVKNLEVDHEFGIFVFKGMVAMRGRDNDFFYTIIYERFDVFFGKFFKNLLAAGLSNTFASAVFLVAQDTEINTGLLEDIDGGLGYFFHPRVIGKIAADKI